LALGVDPPDPDLMKRPPRKVEETIVNRQRGILIGFVGILVMLNTLFVFDLYDPGAQLIKAQTMAFTTIVLSQLFNAFNQRSETQSLFMVGPFKNKWLLIAIALSIGMQAIVIYIPFLQTLFGTAALSAKDWGISIAVSASVLVFGEIVKMIRR
jgi:Ca2+-transporting ATPase